MKRPLAILALTLFLDLLGFGLILPLLPVYITHYGGQPWVGGALLATFSTAQFIFSPIWGRMSDKVGRRPLILLSLCGSAISFIAFGFAPNLLFLFVARVAAGILSAASLPTAQAYIADVTPPEKRASGMAVLGAAFGLGFALGPMIGGYAGRPVHIGAFHISSLQTPALIAATLCFLNFLWALFMLPESLPKGQRQEGKEGGGVLAVFPAISRAMRNPNISAQLTVFTFTTFAFTAVEASFSWLTLLRFRDLLTQNALHAWQTANPGLVPPTQLPQDLIEHAQTAATSSIFAVVGVSAVLTQLVVIRGLAHKVGENRLVMFGAGLLAFSLIGIAFAPSLLLLRVLAAGIAIGSGVMNPSLNALITQAAGPKERGSLSGTQQGLGSMARIIAPPINNTVVAWHPGPLPIGSVPFISSALLMTVAFVLSLRLKPLSEQAITFPKGVPDTLLQDQPAPNESGIAPAIEGDTASPHASGISSANKTTG